LYSDLFQSQFGNYLFNMLRLDFGPSLGLTNRGRPVSEMISEKLPISISLGIMAVTMAMLIGLPLGTLAAINHNRWIDHLAMTFAVLGRSIPNIVLGPVLIIFFAVQTQTIPGDRSLRVDTGTQPEQPWPVSLDSLPAGDRALVRALSAAIARLTRASLLQVLKRGLHPPPPAPRDCANEQLSMFTLYATA